jgi:hypothetical protein
MADENIQQTVETPEVPNQPDFSAQLAEQMAISLNNGMPPAPPDEVAATEPVAPTTEETQPQPEVSAPADAFSVFKEKFGYETPEAAIQEIEQLRALKVAPPQPEYPVVDVNPEFEALLKAWNEGKKEEVWQALDREVRVEKLLNAEVTKDTAAEIVKMGMQLKYKDLTPSEIDYRFNKQFGVPPKPVQDADELEEDFQDRLKSWQDQVTDKQMELMIEAKLAKPELQQYKGKLTFPEIKTETPTDERYLQYLKMLEEQPKVDAEVKAAYKALTPKHIETKINFKDEANKIDFQFQFEPEAEKFSKAVEIASDADQFWKLFTKSDGTPDRERFLDMIYFALDKENYLRAALNQSKNATIKASLPDNSQGGLQRQPVQHTEPSELDKYMRASLNGFM